MSEKAVGRTGPLTKLRVIDAATILAGPLIASLLGDFGADVVKIEHPQGDPLRNMGAKQNGSSLWWKVVSRNKRCITLNLKAAHGNATFKRLIAGADVLIENFRTGTLEAWGLGPDVLMAINPRLVIVRVTGFGQTGPYARRPGFGTLAEAFSGFAHVTGEANGPPTLPPFGLADGVAAHYGAFSTMFALFERDVGGSGRGQVIDLSIYEPLFALLGYQPTQYSQLGTVQKRSGNRSANNAPRNAYQTRDGRWVAVSAAAPAVLKRILTLTGGERFAADPRFSDNEDRVQHADEIDSTVSGWIARHDFADVMRIFEQVEAAIAPVYDVAQIFADPQYHARKDVIEVPDVEFGSIKMQNVFPFLSRTPGEIRFAGSPKGHHNRAVLVDELGLTEAELDGLRAEAVHI